MGQVADLGIAVANTEPMVAVVRCNGTCELRPRIVEYDGLRTKAAQNATGTGETGCGFGCLGCGDCTRACTFDAIHMNPETGLPEVDEDKCTSCGAWREGLSQTHHRVAQEGSEEPPRICELREQGQRCRGKEELPGGLHRLRQVSEGVQV